MSTMDIGVINGLITAVLLVAFIGIIIWAYSSKRRERFDDYAHIPLEEDDQSVSSSQNHKEHRS